MQFEGVIPMQPETTQQVPVQGQGQQAVSASRSRRGWLIALAIFLAFAALLVSGILERVHTSAALRTETAEMAVPTVSVVSPQRSAASQEIVLPGNVQPYVTAPIFSRTNGYLQAWYFDIGAHVKKGQLLAVIATPEVDQQLGRAAIFPPLRPISGLPRSPRLVTKTCSRPMRCRSRTWTMQSGRTTRTNRLSKPIKPT